MLKKYFIGVLATITGLALFGLISFFVITGAVAASFGSNGSNTADKTILHLHLYGDVTERESMPELRDILSGDFNQGPVFTQMLKAVKRAASDKNIKGIYLECGGSSMGMAQRQELIEALNDFKKSGKWIYAYADTYTQGDYLVATVADKVFVNPMGGVDVRGIGVTIPFYTGLMNKLGIKMQVVKVGSFKSAVEPYLLTSISDSARLQTRQFVDSIWGYVATTISDNRHVSVATVNAWADSMLFTVPAEKLVGNKCVTGVKYRRGVENEMRKLVDVTQDKDLPLVGVSDYLASNILKEKDNSKDDHIAVLFAVGDIVDSGKGGIVGDKMVPEIIKLAENEHVKGMVLRVNSGGGSAFASEQIWEALQYFKSKSKPVYVSMGDYAASGGYYISCGADRIYADATTLTGSIGVFGMIPDLSGLVTDKLGVTFSTVSTSDNSTFPSLTQTMTPEQHAAMQRSVEDIYATFIKRVADGRKLQPDQVRRIAEGRVWVGSAAVGLGLVDRLGSLETTVKDLTSACNLDDDDVVSYPANDIEQWQEMIMKLGQNASAEATDMPVDRETFRYLMFVNWLRNLNPIQARMEKITID